MIFLTALVARPDLLQRDLRPRFRYEVLVPYTDAREASVRGLPSDTRLSLLVQVWASDPRTACESARERFREHRVRNRSARMAVEGPVPLRIVRTEESP
jgi:hypothetical protein